MGRKQRALARTVKKKRKYPSESELSTFRRFRAEPEYWAQEVLGVTLDPFQTQVARSVINNTQTDVKSGNEVGKTFVFSTIGLWFLYNFGPMCSVIVTSSTDRQLWRQYWTEVKNLWYNAKYPLGGRMLEKYLEVDPQGKWFMVGFATKDEENFEGWHNENILLIFDEAKGIPENIWKGGERLLRGKGGVKRWLVGGTPPLAPLGEFCQISLDPGKAQFWNHLHLSAWNSSRVAKEACERSLKQHGERSPFYVSMVLGQIPEESAGSLISIAMVEAAAARKTEPGANIEMGIDSGRGGEDESVIMVRRGWKVYMYTFAGKDRTTWCCGRAKRILKDEFGLSSKEAKNISIKVDDTGVGGGVTDNLLLEDYTAIPINFGGKASEIGGEYYYDWGTEMYARLGDYMKSMPIDIPNDTKLKAQLYQRTKTYFTRKGGKIVMKLLSKDELKKKKEFRGFKSPDRADALALCFSGIPKIDVKNPRPVPAGSMILAAKNKGW